MVIKHKDEWSLLLESARANRLDKQETILLFAIREIEDGTKGNEFNKPNVQNTSLAVQADSMALQIQKGEFLYTKYCKGEFPFLILKPQEQPMEFIEFLGTVLMPNEGFHKDKKWILQVKDMVKEITKEFEITTGDNHGS